MRPPINVDKFTNRKRRPSYVLREKCHDVPFEAYTFAEDLRTFQAAIKWFNKHLQAQLLPGECLTNSRSLYILQISLV